MIKMKAQDTLNKEVAEKIKEKEVSHIDSDVYNVYFPTKKYNRTYELKDTSNMHVKQYGEVGIQISNDTLHENLRSSGSTYVADVVEYGSGYEFTGYGYAYEEPRPFQQNTIDELMESGEINKLLIEGLKNRGLK